MENSAGNPPPDEVSLDDALKIAIDLHRAGEVDDAEKLYRRILEHVPEQADALHFLGLVARQRERHAEALDFMRRAVAAAPGYVSAHVNLGNLLQERGDFDAALRSFATALGYRPDAAHIINNIGVVKRSIGDPEAARANFERAAELAPEFALPLENLGRYHYARGDVPKAHDYFCRAVVLDPGLTTSRTFLGIALVRLGRVDEAHAHYEKWIEAEPDDPVPRHMIATTLRDPPPIRACDDYVRRIFDEFAASFDVRLHQLDYRAPRLLLEALRETGLAPQAKLDILDAGCGTGLCGRLLRPYGRRLEGVDLSPRMLDGARLTQAYDELFAGELTAHLAARTGVYDLVASADTLCYFGDLAAVSAAAHRALRPDGLFVFSVEAAPDDAPNGFGIGLSGRYFHTRDYLSEVLVAAGFGMPRIRTDKLRMEAGFPVAGYIVVAVRH